MVSEHLRAAMDAKARELGDHYSYRDLARDSDTHYTTIDKVLRGERTPSVDLLRAWGRALRPYFDVDKALIALGYLPDDPQQQRAIREGIEYPHLAHNTEDALRHLAEMADAAVISGYRVQQTLAHAGDGGDIAGDTVFVPPEMLDSRHVTFTVRGDCMEPDLRDGERVIAHLDGRPVDGQLVVVDYAGAYQIRIYDAKARLLWARDNSPPIPIRDVAAFIPVVAIQRQDVVKKRRPRRSRKANQGE